MTLAVIRHVTLAACLLLATSATTAAPTTIDVGATAINGVWRPGSCADVENGVALTNIVDNTKVVIDSCTIAVAAGADPTNAAVSIAGLGANASVELHGCTLSGHFNIATADWANRAATVRVETNAILGDNSRIVIDNTTVSVKESGVGLATSAVLFDNKLTTGDGFQLQVTNGSTLEAFGCVAGCSGLLTVKSLSPRTAGCRFGPRTRFIIEDSSVSGRSQNEDAFGIFLSNVSFGPHSAVSISRSTVTATSTAHAFGLAVQNDVQFGHSSTLSVTASRVTGTARSNNAEAIRLSSQFGDNSAVRIDGSAVTATAQMTLHAYSLRLYKTSMGDNSTVSVSRSNVTASVQTLYAYSIECHTVTFGRNGVMSVAASTVTSSAATTANGVHFNGGNSFGASGTVTITATNITATAWTSNRAYAFAIWGGVSFATPTGSIAIEKSRLVSSAPSDSGAVFLKTSLSFATVSIVSSTLQFNGSATFGAEPTGALVTGSAAAWKNVSVTVSSSWLVATDGASLTVESFVLWPKTITGFSPQAFRRVTFSPAATTEASQSIAPFLIQPGGARPGPDATLCLTRVRWSNGTAITTGPAAFAVRAGCDEAIATATTTVALSATTTQRTTNTIGAHSNSRSTTRTATQTLSGHRSLSATPTDTAASLKISASASLLHSSASASKSIRTASLILTRHATDTTTPKSSISSSRSLRPRQVPTRTRSSSLTPSMMKSESRERTVSPPAVATPTVVVEQETEKRPTAVPAATKATVVATTAVAASVSAVVGSVGGGALALQRVAALAAFCEPFDPDDVPSVFEHPLRFSAGIGPARHPLGAALGATVLAAVALLLVFGITTGVRLYRGPQWRVCSPNE